MNLIDTTGLLRPVPGLAFLYPFVVTPFEAVYIENQGSRLHSMLAEEGAGITLQDYIAEAVANLVFVMSALANPRNEYFPDPCFDPLSHLMGTAIPALKSPTTLTR
jgi:hypothetical protein